MILPDDPVVAARVVDRLVMPAIELVGFIAFAIERGDDLFVLIRHRLSSICHRQFPSDLDIASRMIKVQAIRQPA
jgi:hypothetical protein